MIKGIDKEQTDIVCIHCSRRIKTVWMCKHVSVIGVRYIYFCSHCQKVLGTSQKKGFANIRYDPDYSKNVDSTFRNCSESGINSDSK